MISIADHEAAMAEKQAQIDALRHELEQLKRLIFSSKQERFVPANMPEQLSMFEEDKTEIPEQAETEANTQTITYERRLKEHPGRTALPNNIPTQDIIIEPEEDTSDMELIGEEITETIDYKPGVLLKRRYIRRKYARREEVDGMPTVVIADMPNRPIPKGIPEAGLLAYLMISKYVDHLPFYRQIEQFKRNFNWSIHKSTINDWFAACCTLLEPLYDKLLEKVMATDYLQADESPIKVQDSDKKGQTHQGYMWVYRNPQSGLVLFDYRKGRGMHGPKERLENFSGLLQCDGYAVYDTIAKKRKTQNLQLVSCLAHIRRKFYQAKDHHPELANFALTEIQKLYSVERACKETAATVEQIKQQRQEKARPVLEQLLQWVNREQVNNLSKGPIGKALHYAKNQLPKLAVYLEDGRLQIDNNLIENAIRPLALGRKNYLFAGSHPAAQRAAMMYSFFASCKTMDVNPAEWMEDVLATIGQHPINKIEELLPDQWRINQREV